jgi:hypothetical protein
MRARRFPSKSARRTTSSWLKSGSGPAKRGAQSDPSKPTTCGLEALVAAILLTTSSRSAPTTTKNGTGSVRKLCSRSTGPFGRGVKE